MEKDALKRLRFVFVVFIYVLFWVGGVRRDLFSEGRQTDTDLLLHLACASLMSLFCMVDSNITAKRLTTAHHWFTFALWPVCMPIYLIWSRGFRGVLLVLVHAVGIVVAFSLGQTLVNLLR